MISGPLSPGPLNVRELCYHHVQQPERLSLNEYPTPLFQGQLLVDSGICLHGDQGAI